MSLENCQRVVEEFPRPPAYFNLFENAEWISPPNINHLMSDKNLYDVLYDGYFSQAKLPFAKSSGIERISVLRSELVNESKNILNSALDAIVAESDDELVITNQFMKIHSSLQLLHCHLAAYHEQESKCKLIKILTTKQEKCKAEEQELQKYVTSIIYKS